MKALGFIAELEGRAGLPLLAQTSNRLDPSVKPMVLEYLGHGTRVFDVMGTSPDPLNPAQVIDGGPSLVTDGEFVWRLDLANYVSAHNIELPADFIERATAAVRSQSFPAVINSRTLLSECFRPQGGHNRVSAPGRKRTSGLSAIGFSSAGRAHAGARYGRERSRTCQTERHSTQHQLGQISTEAARRGEDPHQQ